MNLSLKNGKYVCICSKFSLKCVEGINSRLFNATIISCLFPYRVGIYRQVLHLFIKTITVCGKLMTKYMATNNMGTFFTITIG